MWLAAPTQSPSLVWEGRANIDYEVAGSSERGSPSERSPVPPPVPQEELPIVSIGAPETWPIQDVYPVADMPGLMRSSLVTWAYYFVRFYCSFRPEPGVDIEWARFAIHLQPDEHGHQPVAADQHPMRVEHDTQRNVKVSLSPSLKFQAVEAKLGSVDFGFEYSEIQPLVSAAGIGEARPSWDYLAAPGIRVHGSKWMHALVKAPRAMHKARASLALEADIIKGNSIRLPVFVRHQTQVAEPIVVTLWS
jgi:hypothetical protein